MIIGNAGYIYDVEMLRAIGRVAMPLFAFGIVRGYESTQSKDRYAMRLLIMGLVAQPIYMAIFTEGCAPLNPVLGLLTGMLLIESRRYLGDWVLLSIPVMWIAYMDIYPVLLIVICYYCRDIVTQSVAMALLTGFRGLTVNPLCFLSWFAVPILYINVRVKDMINKYAYYAVYPLHLAVLQGAKWAL